MELRQLRYFVRAAELGSFSEAAKALNVTQSTLSQQIKTLEDELSAELLIRLPHGVQLTDVGEAFLPTACQTLADANDIKDRVRDIQGLVEGSLTIGATYTFSPLLSDILVDYTRQYPGVKVNIICGSVGELMRMLEDQQVDIVLSYRPSDIYPNIDSYTLFQNRLAAVMSITHPLASSKSLSVVNLANYKLALPAPGMQARNTFDDIIASSRDTYKVRIEVGYISVLLDLVSASQFVTVLSCATIKDRKDLVAIPLTDSGSRMEGCYHVKRGVYMKCAARAFLRVVEIHKPFVALRNNL